MSALSQTLTSLRHRPGRAALTALGSALGIGTIVALLAVSAGATQTAGQFVDLGRSDLGLFQKDAADPTTSVLPTSLIGRLRREPGIASATSLQLLVGEIARSPGAIVFGATAHNFLTDRMVFTSGHMFTSRRQIVIGDALARQLRLRPGSVVSVARRPFTVAGIYHIGVAYQDTGAFISLSAAQRISGHPGEATSLVVKLAAGERQSAARRMIATRIPGLLVIADGDEALRAGANGQLISNVTLVIVVLALLIGGIGVMNTMLMSVIERRVEFALLSAIGWSGPQIANLVLTEGLIVSVLGALAGMIIGSFGAELLVHLLGAEIFVSPQVTAWVLGRALLIGVLIGVFGGLYPAWRAAHLSPAQTLAQH